MKTSTSGVRNMVLAAALALPLLVTGGAARADGNVPPDQPPMMPGEPGPGPHGPHGLMNGGRPPFLRGVELSEAQEDKVFAILHAEAPYLREQSRAAAKARDALHALGDSDKFDDAKATSLAKDAATAEANIMLQHARTQQKLLAVLTPEQRKKQADEPPRHPPRP